MSTSRVFHILAIAVVLLSLAGPGQATLQPFPDTHDIDGLADGPTSVATADFDRDGDMDVAATIRWDGAVSWWENPSWVEHSVATGFTQAHHLVTADMNEDGWPDLVAGNRGTASANVVWYQNPGAAGGVWTAHDVSGSGLIDGVLALAVGDIEGDGYLDIAIAGFKTGYSDGIVMWFQNSGGSIFYAHDVDLALPTAHSIAIGDITGSGNQNLVVASYGDNKVVWYRRLGAHPGSAWERHDIATGVSGAVHVLLEDLDADRDLDAVACAYNGDEVFWFENVDGADSWVAHSLGTVDGPYDIDAVDLDRDGDIDLVGAGRDDGTLRWWDRTSPGSFIKRTGATGLSGARSTAIADLDNDGDLDVAVAADTSDTVAWVENGSTKRTARMVIDSTPCGLLWVDIRDLEIIDVDNDGQLDVVAAVGDSEDLLIARRTATGFSCTTHDILPAGGGSLVFQEGTNRFVATGDDGSIAHGACWYSSVTGMNANATVVNTGDLLNGVSDAIPVNLDGDRDLDLVAVSPVENRLAWWRTDPPSYSYHWIANIEGAVSVRAADLDRDGDQDLALAATTGDIIWLENENGDGLTWSQHLHGLLTGGVAIRIGDFNNDGWQDLMAAGDGVDEIRWWENLGYGGGSLLWTPRTAALLDNPGTLELADLDRDGCLDAVVSRPDAGTLAWVRNYDCMGLTWAALSITGTWADVVDVAVGDVLADGYPDLMVAERAWGTLAALSNLGGQFSINAMALAPDSLEPNQQVPIFLLLPGHLGRSSDLALELRSVNLHVDDGVTKLTTTQLRSVFSTLSVYYDANENFVFDASDWQLEQDTSPFVDAAGDLRLDVDPGVLNPPITKTHSPIFFVVATTTANPAASIAGIRLLHQRSGWSQLGYDDFSNMRARPEYFAVTSSGLIATSSSIIFANGFESGNTTAWSDTVP